MCNHDAPLTNERTEGGRAGFYGYRDRESKEKGSVSAFSLRDAVGLRLFVVEVFRCTRGHGRTCNFRSFNLKGPPRMKGTEIKTASDLNYLALKPVLIHIYLYCSENSYYVYCTGYSRMFHRSLLLTQYMMPKIK